MRRVMLLALLALALSTAASASSFTFATSQSSRLVCPAPLGCSSGEFQSGTISGSITNGGSVDISVVGNSKTTPFFSFDVGPLTKVPCFPGGECFDFKTGTVTIENAAGATVFTSSIINGVLPLELHFTETNPRYWVQTLYPSPLAHAIHLGTPYVRVSASIL